MEQKLKNCLFISVWGVYMFCMVLLISVSWERFECSKYILKWKNGLALFNAVNIYFKCNGQLLLKLLPELFLSYPPGKLCLMLLLLFLEQFCSHHHWEANSSSCSWSAYMLGGVGLRSGTMGKLGSAWHWCMAFFWLGQLGRAWCLVHDARY